MAPIVPSLQLAKTEVLTPYTYTFGSLSENFSAYSILCATLFSTASPAEHLRSTGLLAMITYTQITYNLTYIQFNVCIRFIIVYIRLDICYQVEIKLSLFYSTVIHAVKGKCVMKVIQMSKLTSELTSEK